MTNQLEDSNAKFIYTVENFVTVAKQAANKYGKIKVWMSGLLITYNIYFTNYI